MRAMRHCVASCSRSATIAALTCSCMTPPWPVTGVTLFASYEVTRWSVTGQVNFGSHLDAAITIAARLVNDLTPGQARGRDYTPPEDAAISQLLPPEDGVQPQVTPADAAALSALATQLRVVFAR